MSLLCIHFIWDKAEAFSHPMNVSVNGKSLSSHTKEKEAVNGFWANAFKATQHLLDLFRTHLLEEGKAQLPFTVSNPPQDIKDASCFLSG